MLYRKVSTKVADAGLNVVLLASPLDGAAAAAGMKINELAATPRTSVRGKRLIIVAVCAAETEGILLK